MLISYHKNPSDAPRIIERIILNDIAVVTACFVVYASCSNTVVASIFINIKFYKNL